MNTHILQKCVFTPQMDPYIYVSIHTSTWTHTHTANKQSYRDQQVKSFVDNLRLTYIHIHIIKKINFRWMLSTNDLTCYTNEKTI